MSQVHIVTDSSAQFVDPNFPTRRAITVVPLIIHWGKRSFQEGIDMRSVDFLRGIADAGALPVLASPTVEYFTNLYETLSRSTDRIVSVHLSSKLSRTARNAATAAANLRGRCKIEIIDSLSISGGVGFLVEQATLAAERGETLEEIVRSVRSHLQRMYAVFFVDTLDYLAHSGRIGPAPALLGDMLGIKPLLAIEEGDLITIEKVRQRAQAIERLLEFVLEFDDITYMMILHGGGESSRDAHALLERLKLELPQRQWPLTTYGPSLGTFLGPDALGVVIVEGERTSET